MYVVNSIGNSLHLLTNMSIFAGMVIYWQILKASNDLITVFYVKTFSIVIRCFSIRSMMQISFHAITIAMFCYLQRYYFFFIQAVPTEIDVCSSVKT